jgi:4-hydroxymandelate oxidase
MHEYYTVSDIEQYAKSRLNKEIYDFIAGGARSEITLENNNAIYSKYALMPKILSGVRSINLSNHIDNTKYAVPFMVAPMALAKLCHMDGEIAIASACKKMNVNFISSSMSSIPLEDIAVNSSNSLWFQLYPFSDLKITQDLINRAEKAGFTAVVITIDMPLMAKRLRDFRNKFTLPSRIKFANIEPYGKSNDTAYELTDSLFHSSLTWEELAEIVSCIKVPVYLKGLFHLSDIDKISKMNIKGIIISNHGGRQLDPSPSALELLPAFDKYINNSMAIGIDGGIRSGKDIFISLALGADFVLIGRPVFWALAAGGQHGIEKLFEIITSELIEIMHLCGVDSISNIYINRKDLIFKRFRF